MQRSVERPGRREVASERLFDHHPRARRPGHVGRPVGGAVVHDDQVPHHARGHRGHHGGDGRRFIQGRDDEGDAGAIADVLVIERHRQADVDPIVPPPGWCSMGACGPDRSS